MDKKPHYPDEKLDNRGNDGTKEGLQETGKVPQGIHNAVQRVVNGKASHRDHGNVEDTAGLSDVQPEKKQDAENRHLHTEPLIYAEVVPLSLALP